MYVRAKVPRGAPASALTVPQQAVLRSAGGQAYAWVIAGDGKAVIRTLEGDGSVDRQWLVRHGLKAGERVIVSNGSAVALGQQVKAVAATPAQLAAMPAIDPNGNTDEKSH
ncbi:hypothetical protein G6F40_014599 [Rhizopus arrhizus]|nr:hypothetical protein G6F40_014599 [Rhizopus arrhizus]